MSSNWRVANEAACLYSLHQTARSLPTCACSLLVLLQVLVWHTKTKPADNPNMNLMRKVTKYNETNLPSLYQHVMETDP